ncbi:MAG: hypothetical protein Kow001_15530 [Acidobacteriota bacterium]
MNLVELWLEKQPALVALAVAVLGDRDRVDDVMQEAFTRVYRNGRSFRDSGEAFRYLRAVVINTAIDDYRRHRRYLDTFRVPDGEPRDEGDASTPLQILLRKEGAGYRSRLMKRLRAGLERLDPEEREAIEIFFGPRRRPLNEYCREHGTSYSVLRRRMQRAIDRLRSQFQEERPPGLEWCVEDEQVELVSEEES